MDFSLLFDRCNKKHSPILYQLAMKQDRCNLYICLKWLIQHCTYPAAICSKPKPDFVKYLPLDNQHI